MGHAVCQGCKACSKACGAEPNVLLQASGAGWRGCRFRGRLGTAQQLEVLQMRQAGPLCKLLPWSWRPCCTGEIPADCWSTPLPCSPVHATVQGTWGQGELAVESSCHQTNSTLFSQAGFGEGRGEGPATTNAPGNVQQAAPAEPLQAAATTSCSGLATGLSEAVAGLVRDACEPECPDTALAELLRSVFKHKNFRGPQLGVIRRVLRGESTLAILPTGALSPNPSLHAAAQ